MLMRYWPKALKYLHGNNAKKIVKVRNQFVQFWFEFMNKNRYAMRKCVCYLEIIVWYVVLSSIIQNVCFVGFVWCHICFVPLKIKETVEKKFKSLKDKLSGS